MKNQNKVLYKLLIVILVTISTFSESRAQAIPREVKQYFLAVHDQNTQCGQALLRKDSVIDQASSTIKGLVITIDSLKADIRGYKIQNEASREGDSLQSLMLNDAIRREKNANTRSEICVGVIIVLAILSLL